MSPPPSKASTLKKKPSTTHNLLTPSAVNINSEEQLLQDLQFLIGLLDRTVSLHIAGDVVADVIHQGDGVGRVSLLQRLSILFDDLCKLRLLHQLWQTD